MQNPTVLSSIEHIASQTQKLRQALANVFIGQNEIIEQIIIALFSGGHILLTGVPGLGKTKLVRSLASLMALSFKRIQFTPDLMPSDILGGDILQSDALTGERNFRFQPGAIFANVILADEINRTPPKTQSALLEAMGELQVTISGTTRPLPSPFIVLATQNPIEQAGTYPLPEAQLDRFLLNAVMHYLPMEEEIKMVNATTAPEQLTLSPIFETKDILDARSICREIIVPPTVVEEAVRICCATRPGHQQENAKLTQYVKLGAGSRASQALILAAKARALLQGRPVASLEDIKAVQNAVLRHRIILNFRANAEKITIDALLEELS